MLELKASGEYDHGIYNILLPTYWNLSLLLWICCQKYIDT